MFYSFLRTFAKYFKKHVNGYDVKTNDKPGWNMGKNEILGYKTWLPFDDPRNQAALENTIGLGWPDYFFGSTLVISGILDSIILYQ